MSSAERQIELIFWPQVVLIGLQCHLKYFEKIEFLRRQDVLKGFGPTLTTAEDIENKK